MQRNSIKKYIPLLSPALGLGLLGFALWVLSKELKQYDFFDVMDRIHSIPQRNIWEALGLCVFSYIILTAYDYLGLKYVKVTLSYWRIALSSFVAYSLSHNLGFAIFTGGAARLRMYARWNVRPKDVAKQVAFVNVMFTLGFCTLAGFSFIFNPSRLMHFSYYGTFILGAVLLLLVLGFFIAISRSKKSLKIFGWNLPKMPLGLGLSATAIAAFDWAVAAAVCWRLFPEGSISFLDFMSVYFIAQIVALISHVPGGIGVFEGIMVAALSDILTADKVLGCLLVYRLVYYLLPFFFAVLLYAGCEYRTHKSKRAGMLQSR